LRKPTPRWEFPISSGGKFEEAGAWARKAIELDPDDFIAYWTLGRIHFTNGEFQLTYDAYQRVIKLKPEFVNGYSDLRMTRQRLGREQDAALARRELLERMPNYLLQNPDDARQRMFYATVLAEIGRNDEAPREGAQAQELRLNDPLMLYNAGCVYSRLGEPGAPSRHSSGHFRGVRELLLAAEWPEPRCAARGRRLQGADDCAVGCEPTAAGSCGLFK
jgi:tetratricopeptide (TPR) repeat protein